MCARDGEKIQIQSIDYKGGRSSVGVGERITRYIDAITHPFHEAVDPIWLIGISREQSWR
ncbi:hypothetical protein A6767_13025 [Aeromonas veronii]|nr:hypothetical protein A6767_13025 [Aeromonas veronii]